MKTFFNLSLGALVGLIVGLFIGSALVLGRPGESARAPDLRNSAVQVVDISRREYRKDRRFSDILWLVGVSHAIGTDDIVEKSLREVKMGIEAGIAIHHVNVERE